MYVIIVYNYKVIIKITIYVHRSLRLVQKLHRATDCVCTGLSLTILRCTGYVPHVDKHKKKIFREFSFIAAEVYCIPQLHYYFIPLHGLHLAPSLHLRLAVILLVIRLSTRRSRALSETTHALFLFIGIN